MLLLGVAWVLTAMPTHMDERAFSGPGAGEWETELPDKHGLDERNLIAAAARTAEVIPVRDCFLLAKDGKIMYEEYYRDNGPETVYESDSMTKTATALLIGVLVQHGLVDLDTPIKSYGVIPQANWSRNAAGIDYFPMVTARHLLGQTTGVGMYPPGSTFTYDSDAYLQHLSYLVGNATGIEPVKWATKYFAEPLGIPEFYMLDLLGPDISVGGGQMVTCRDAARFGQLVANKGLWSAPASASAPTASAAGHGHAAAALLHSAPYQLISEEYARLMSTPSFPSISSCYSLLTWINSPKQGPSGANCFAARWGCSAGTGEWVNKTTLIGDDVGSDNLAPADTGVGMGWLGKYLYFIPSRNTTVVSMGNSWGSSLECDIGLRSRGYDDSWAMTMAWRGFGNLSKPTVLRGVYRDSTTLESGRGLGASNSSSSSNTTRGRRGSSSERGGGGGAGVVSAAGVAGLPGRSKSASQRMHTWQGNANVDSSAGVEGSVAGSCVCTCPPGQGFGLCFDNIYNGTNSSQHGVPQCSAVATPEVAAATCPKAAIPRQCNASSVNASHCENAKLYGMSNCSTKLHTCGPASFDEKGGDNVGGIFDFEVCECIPETFSCTWSPTPCTYSPYFPPG